MENTATTLQLNPLCLLLLLFSSLKCQSSVAVRREDLLDRVDVRGRSQVQAQVVLHRRLHDGPRRPLHRVVQAGVHDVLLTRSGDALLEGLGRRHGDASADTAKATLQRLLHRLYNIFKFPCGLTHSIVHEWAWKGGPCKGVH